MIAAYALAALAAVLTPALLVLLAVTVSDALQARHDAKRRGADEDDRAVEFQGFISFHSEGNTL